MDERKPPFSLIDRNIVITGASSGIGRQCAIFCSQMGANVLLIGRNKERLLQTYTELAAGNHGYYLVDITDYGQVESIISDIVFRHGKIWGFIHSAGIELTLPLRATKPGILNKVFETNVISGFEWSRVLTQKKYIHPDGGSLIFIASVMGILGKPGKIAYSSSKGALIAGCKAMALELSGKKIRVNSISPAMVQTEMAEALFESLTPDAVDNIVRAHPLGMGQPSDVAWACCFLLSDAARWITGSNLVIDGGYSIQ
jgi:NAD(P)-dependent dehydrogenase (short-subunit alcohol dehydrogenase family)